MAIDYKEGALCILKHTHDLHNGETKCKRRFVRATILCPNTNGITKIFSEVNGPIYNSFECSNELGSCGCEHAEQKVIRELLMSISTWPPVFQYILLSSYSPCTQCANAIIGSKMINTVIYDRVYETDTRGLEMLSKAMPTLSVKTIEDIAAGQHRGELTFVKRWRGYDD